MSESRRRFCPKCGASIESGDLFCVNCGAKLAFEEPARATDPTADAATPPAKPKRSWTRLLWLLVVGVAAYFGGQFLGGQMAGGFKKSEPTTVPLALNTPIARSADESSQASEEAALPTAIPVGTPLPTHDLSSLIPVVTMPSLDEIMNNREAWDYHTASDSEIREAMSLFWFGTDSRTGANCAFFTNATTDRGGYYWWIKNNDGFKAAFDLGTLIDERDGALLSASGRTPLLLDLHNDGALDFNFGDDDYISGSMRLYPDGTRREEVLNMVLNYKHTLEKMS